MLKYFLVYGGTAAISVAFFLLDGGYGNTPLRQDFAVAFIPIGITLLAHGVVVAINSYNYPKKSGDGK